MTTNKNRPIKPTKPRQPGYDWYREQRVKLRSEYPDRLDFPIPPKSRGFTNAQKAAIAQVYEREQTKYLERYNQLKDYHDFSFKKPRGKRDFTPQEKAAISRKYAQLAPVIQGVKKGLYTAIPIKTKTGKRKVPEKVLNDFPHTNKVVLINEQNSKLKIKKVGKKIRYTIVSKTPEKQDGIHRTAHFIPVPGWLEQNPTLLPYWMLDLTKQYPCHVFRRNHDNKMVKGMVFTPDQWGYFQNRENVYKSFLGGESMFSGLWAIEYSCKELEQFYGTSRDEQEQNLLDQIYSLFEDDDPLDTLDSWIDTD